jgi:hypothetical protein
MLIINICHCLSFYLRSYPHYLNRVFSRLLAQCLKCTVVKELRLKTFRQVPVMSPQHDRHTSEVASSNPAHGQVYSIQRYTIKFVSDFRQDGGFLQILWFPPPIKLTTTVAPLWRMGPRCSSAETQVCHRSYIIAVRFPPPMQLTTIITTEILLKVTFTTQNQVFAPDCHCRFGLVQWSNKKVAVET